MEDEFYGREEELDRLLAEFNDLKNPKIVFITASSGYGKTRLIQEFYNRVCENSTYWKRPNISNHEKQTNLVTEFDKDGTIDCLFLVAKATQQDFSSSNNYDFCIEKIQQQFSEHMKSVLKEKKQKEVCTHIFQIISSIVLDIIPGSVLLKVFEIGKKIMELIFPYKSNDHASSTKILNQIINAFKITFHKHINFKVIIVIEDAHWIDSYSITLLGEINQEAIRNEWPILFIYTGWGESLIEKNADNNNNYRQLVENIRAIRRFEKCINIELDAVSQQSTCDYVKSRIPHINQDSCEFLAYKCNGDFDFLNDLISEICEYIRIHNISPEFITKEYIENLPSKSVELAKERLRKYPQDIQDILYWSSLQGVYFDKKFISNLLGRLSKTDIQLTEKLKRTDHEYGLTLLKEDPDLELLGEFRRATNYEVCLNMIQHAPNIEEIRRAMLDIYIQVYSDGIWEHLQNERKTRYIVQFDKLCNILSITDSYKLEIRNKLILYLQKSKLNIGDYNNAIRLGDKLLEYNLTSELSNELYSNLADAYYMAGDSEKESNIYKLWQTNNSLYAGQFNEKYAAFLRRSSKATESVASLNKVIENTNATDSIYPKIKAELLKAEWAQGNVKKAYEDLKEFENNYLPKDENDSVMLNYCEAAYLILHDLEKNRQSVIFAQECHMRHQANSNEQQQRMYFVNEADALWGLGYHNKAKNKLDEVIEYARKKKLLQLLDISLICCANICATTNEYELADKYYTEGVKLAKEISHAWDYYYGCIYYNLFKLNTNQFDKLEEIKIVDEYNYLKELDTAVELYKKYKTHQPVIPEYVFAVPAAEATYRAILYNQNPSPETVNDFAKALAELEGIKFNKIFIFETVSQILEDKQLDESIKSQLVLWQNCYSSKIESVKSVKIVGCDFRACEARCCYDGVYLKDAEVENITKLVNENKQYFDFLPKDYIIDSQWRDVIGKKTAVRAFDYKRYDFPKHFNKTRCVFANDKGECTLQKFAMDTNKPPHTYKPIACKIYPLELRDGKICAPCKSKDKNTYFTGVCYPGYENYTPCGINRIDGENWESVLNNEIKAYKRFKDSSNQKN